MNRAKANILIVLLLLLWFFLGGSCMAAESPSDLELLGELKGNLTQLSNINRQLARESLTVKNALTKSETKLSQANKQLEESKLANAQQKVLLENLNVSLKNLSEELKQEKAINKRHKWQKALWTTLGFMGGVVVGKAVKEA